MKKKKWLGALLSFIIPGLGTIYSRKLKKGILLYVLFVFAGLSLRFVAYTFPLFLITLTLIAGVYLFILVNGYRDVEKEKEYESAPFDKWYVYVAIIIVMSVVYGLIKRPLLDAYTPINFARIPTPAMHPTLMIGDILAFRKTQAITRNDVVIFREPEQLQTMYVKRCIGLPGDSLRIDEGVSFINGDSVIGTPPLMYKYMVATGGSDLNDKILKKLKIFEDNYYSLGSGFYQMFLTAQQANNLRALSFKPKVELSLHSFGDRDRMIFPKADWNNWNADHYGPIYIPKRGDEIPLTSRNVDLYRSCIKFETPSASISDSTVSVDGKQLTRYRFKQDYFFMLGDSRHNSLDSRYWGFLPQQLVIGKVLYLYWAKDTGRIGQSIH